MRTTAAKRFAQQLMPYLLKCTKKILLTPSCDFFTFDKIINQAHRFCLTGGLFIALDIEEFVMNSAVFSV